MIPGPHLPDYCRFSPIFGAREQDEKSTAAFSLDADNTLFDYDSAEIRGAHGDSQRRAAGRFLCGDGTRRLPRNQRLASGERLEQGTHLACRAEAGPVPRAPAISGLCRGPAGHFFTIPPGAFGQGVLFSHAKEVVEEAAPELSPGAGHKRDRDWCSADAWRNPAWRGCFRAVIISEELGLAKPDPRFFKAAREAISLPSDELLCIGDNPASDIEGARAAGIDVCWYAPKGQPWPGPGDPPSLVIRDLAEILPLASSIFT